MAKVHLLSVALDASGDNTYALGSYRHMLECQRADRFKVHTLTDDPAEADLILFVEIAAGTKNHIKVRRHPLVQRFREKCFLTDPADMIIPFLPGVYASIEKRWHSPRRTRSGPFPVQMGNAAMEYDPSFTERDYLYSFIGDATTSLLRPRLGKLGHPRGHYEDRSADSLRIRMTGSEAERVAFVEHFADVARRSHFVLCPRGLGSSSIRLFEAMRVGRVPVILSDAWVAPDGPDWESFSVRVPERDLEKLPALLEAREADARAMGLLARQAWEEWFAPTVLFHRTVEQCLAIQRARRLPEWLASLLAWPQVILRPFHLRRLMGGLLKQRR